MAVTPEFIQDMETLLGGNLVDVELEQIDYDSAFDRAKRVFIQRGNNNLDFKYYGLNVLADQDSYTIPLDQNIDTVVRIIKPRSSLNSADPFSSYIVQSAFKTGYYQGGGYSFMIDYTLFKQSLKDLEMMSSYTTDFRFKKRTGELLLLDQPKGDETWLLEVYANLTDAEYEEIQWIRDYTLAELKIILGRAYRKFASLTTPSGETSLDGNELVQEGKEEQTILLEDIMNFVDGDVSGSVMIIG